MIPIVYDGAWHKATAGQKVIFVIIFISVIKGRKASENLKKQCALQAAASVGRAAPRLP